MNEQLSRSRIIRRRSTFDLTRQRGRRFNNRWMTLSVLRREPEAADSATVAFLTPKRLGPASLRNKLRRRMREIYRRKIQRESETSYLIWIARPASAELSFEELKKAMVELQRRSVV